MAHLFKQTTTRPLPAGAELFTRNGERFARWTDGKGRKRTARVTGEGDTARIQTESATWYVRLRRADGELSDVATGCRDKSAAASRLSELVAEQEKIRAGVITPSEANTAKHGRMAYAGTVQAFIDSMAARGCVKGTCNTWRHYLISAGVDGLDWRTLADMDRAGLERWLSMRAVTPKDPEKPDSIMGARNHNAHVAAFAAFGAWCLRQGYVKANPFAATAKRNEKADRRHVRRALTVDELARLVDAARRRPCLEAVKINRGPNKGKPGADVSEETLDRLRFLGWTRALAYWTAAATGLRWGELRSITLGAVRLDADPPHVILQAKSEKARRGAQIPVQADLAAELGKYLVERRSRLVGRSGASIVEFPGVLDSVPVFDVPEKMSKVFHADCKAAGVPRHDGAGRAVDVHALRHTFGTMLAKAGVSLQVAQRAMRHSTPTLTANVYTHLGLVDVAGAVEKLPSIGMGAHQAAAEMAVNSVTPTVTPGADISSDSGTMHGNITPFEGYSATAGTDRVLTNKDGAGQQGAIKENGGRSVIRTRDPLRVKQVL